MSLRFTSQLNVDNLPDEQLNDQFEVIMPELEIDYVPRDNPDPSKGEGLGNRTFWSSVTGMKYRPIVEEITFGFKNFSTDTRRIRTGWYNVPRDIESYHDVKITMFCPNTMETQHYLEAWRRLIFNDAGEYYNSFLLYKKNIDVFVYGPGGTGVVGNTLGLVGNFLNTKSHYTLQGCFPYKEQDFELQYTDDPKRLRILAWFKVDSIKCEIPTTNLGSALSSPSAMIGNVLSGLTSLGASKLYDIDATYGGKSGTAAQN